MPRILKVIGIVFGVPLVILIIVGIIYSIDESPPNDADLRLARLNVPDEENAFTCFKEAAENLVWPNRGSPEWCDFEGFIDGSPYDADDTADPATDATRPEPWDAERVGNQLARNEEALRLVGQGLARGKVEAPRSAYFGADEPYLLPLRNLRKPKALLAISLMKAGKPHEAMDEAFSLIRLGRMVEQSRGPVLTYLIGVSLRQSGYWCIIRILGGGQLDDATLREYHRTLETLKPETEALINSAKVDYGLEAQLLHETKSGEIFRRAGNRKITVPGVLFHRNATQRLFAQMRRTQIENISRKPGEYAVSEIQKLKKEQNGPWGWRMLLDPNLAGRYLAGLLAVSDDMLAKSFRCAIMPHGQTRLMIALKRYKLKTGSLPKSLAELKPDYIDDVPADPFDGKPMRYNSDKKVIYSIGDDLKDDGGHSEKDEVYRIRF